MAKAAAKKAPRPAKGPAGKAYTQPSKRTYRTWDPGKLRSVERTVDSGSMHMLADLCDQLGADERVRKALETVVGGLLSLPLTFEDPDGPKRGRSKRQKAIEADWWQAFPEPDLQQFLASGRLAGISFAQLVDWRWVKGRYIPRLEPWHLANFRYDTNARQWFASTANDGEVPVTPGDGRWVMYAPYGSQRPWSHGLWRGLSRWWLLKAYAISDWGRHSEKGSTLVATPEADSENDYPEASTRKELCSDLSDLASEGVVVLPNGFNLDLLEVAANTERIYKGQIQLANTSIDIAIQGQNLTSEVSEGSRAAATIHDKVEQRVIRSVGATASTTLREHALKPWAQFNFGDAELAPWPKWATDPPENRQLKATVLKTVADAVSTLKTAGYRVAKEQLEEEYGIKVEQVDASDAGGDPATGGGKSGGERESSEPEPDDENE